MSLDNHSGGQHMFPDITNDVDDFDIDMFQDYENSIVEHEHNTNNSLDTHNNDSDPPHSSNLYDTSHETSSSPSRLPSPEISIDLVETADTERMEPVASQDEDIKLDPIRMYLRQDNDSRSLMDFHCKPEPIDPPAEMPMLNDAVAAAAEESQQPAPPLVADFSVDSLGSISVDEVLQRAEAQVLENRSLLQSVNESNNNSSCGALNLSRRRSIMPFNLVTGNVEVDEVELQHHLEPDTVPNSLFDLVIPPPVADNSSSVVTLEISDNDDDDDVVFVSRTEGNRAPLVVDLCDSVPTSPVEILEVNSPATAAGSTSPSVVDNTALGSIAEADAAIEDVMFQMHSDHEHENRQREQDTAADARNVQIIMEKHKLEMAEMLARTEEAAATAAAAMQEAENRRISCAVCLESPFSNQPTATTCGHVFCAPCIRGALLATKKCPLCNRKLSPRQLHALYV